MNESNFMNKALLQKTLDALQNCANGEDDVMLTREVIAELRIAIDLSQIGGCLSDCDGCKYRTNPYYDRHCYMFTQEPIGICGQFGSVP